MPRTPKVIPGPSRLSKIIGNLERSPQMSLSGLRGLKLTLAARNDHFGARHFIKEELPRIQYANPALHIEVNKVVKSKDDIWKPEMVLQYENGKEHILDLDRKWSTTIVKELMEKAGDDSWREWKTQARAAGLPLVLGEDMEQIVQQNPQSPPSSTPIFNETNTEISNVSSCETSGRVGKRTLPLEQPRAGVSAALP